MNDDEPPGIDVEAIRSGLLHLRQAHADLDAAVAALLALPDPDQLRVARLKKRKLVLRDQIAQLENRLTPDLIA
ncbi:MAG: DUF465 domain-containing protein [Caulobacteraceae bacterium]